MKKIIKMSTFIFTILFVFPIFVFANENYYINKIKIWALKYPLLHIMIDNMLILEYNI